jgi:serine-type D-Ala-D-Ala carboxypeptidase/endopeptidase
MPPNYSSVGDNFYATYAPENMFETLKDFRPDPATFGKMSYSNLGAGLLGYVLAQKLSISYEQAVISRICEPLALPDTRVTLNQEQRLRLAPGHNMNLVVKNWDFDALAGAGALRSTIKDMQKFLRANIQTSSSTAFLQSCHKTRVNGPLSSNAKIPSLLLRGLVNSIKLFRFRRPKNRYRKAIGLGWIAGQLSVNRQSFLWHNGETAGYCSFVGFCAETQTGVAVLCNQAPHILDGILEHFNVSDIGFGILEHLNSAL